MTLTERILSKHLQFNKPIFVPYEMLFMEIFKTCPTANTNNKVTVINNDNNSAKIIKQITTMIIKRIIIL